MKCTTCGNQNNDNANFCVSCGASLTSGLHDNLLRCAICGSENNPASVFCSNCGNFLPYQIPKKSRQNTKKTKEKLPQKNQREKKRSRIVFRSTAAFIGMVVLVILLETRDSRTPSYHTPSAITFLSDSTMVAAATAESRSSILSQFKCPCVNCSDELKDCVCNHPNGANDVRSFIDKQIAKRTYTVAQVIDIVEKKYGGRKL